LQVEIIEPPPQTRQQLNVATSALQQLVGVQTERVNETKELLERYRVRCGLLCLVFTAHTVHVLSHHAVLQGDADPGEEDRLPPPRVPLLRQPGLPRPRLRREVQDRVD